MISLCFPEGDDGRFEPYSVEVVDSVFVNISEEFIGEFGVIDEN